MQLRIKHVYIKIYLIDHSELLNEFLLSFYMYWSIPDNYLFCEIENYYQKLMMKKGRGMQLQEVTKRNIVWKVMMVT